MPETRLNRPVVGRAQTIIRSTPSSIFDFIGENFFSNYPRWSPEVVELEKISEGQITVGTMARQVRIDQRHRLESKFQVTKFQVGKCLEFEGVPDPFRCTFDISEVKTNHRTHLIFTFEGLELRPHMRPFEKLIRRVVQDGAERTARNLKHLIERQERRRAISNVTKATR